MRSRFCRTAPRVFVAMVAGALIGACTAGFLVRPSIAQPYALPFELSESTLFEPGVISTGFEEGFCLAPDGQTCYFVRRLGDPSVSTIMESRFQDGSWSEPRVASFSGRHHDYEPFVSPDGQRLFFASFRPVPPETTIKWDRNLWYVERAGSGWSEPRLVDSVRTPHNENYPVVAADGTLYFGSSRPGGRGLVDLYVSHLVDGSYGAPEPIRDLNTYNTESDPYVAPDQSFMIFAIRHAGAKTGDLFISSQNNGRWSVPQPLSWKVNTPEWDYAPHVTPDRKYLFFTRSGFIQLIELEAARPPEAEHP